MRAFLISTEVSADAAFAYSTRKYLNGEDLIEEIGNKTALPFEMKLKRVILKNDDIETTDDLTGIKELWLDYLPNELAWPFMSKKMMEIVQEHLTGKEKVTWLTVEVKAKREKRVYYIPRFNQLLDVLDTGKTIYAEGTDHIVKPVFSVNKVKNLAIFKENQVEWQTNAGIFYSEPLKIALEKASLSGVLFEQIPQSMLS